MLSWLTILIACAPDPKLLSVDSDPRVDSSDSALPIGPCADGGYAEILDPGAAIHVRADGDDSGDGSLGAPLATPGAALALARAEGINQTILIGPGTFEIDANLQGDDGLGGSDNGLALVGCAVDETTLMPVAAEESAIASTGVTGLVLRGFTLQGGRPSLWLWRGTEAELFELAIVGAGRLGILVDGSDTIVTATGVTVSDTTAETAASGIEGGCGVQSHLAMFTATDLAITGSTTVGLLVDGGAATFVRLSVSNTVTDSTGTMGRGLQVQNYAALDMTEGAFYGNHDAGVYVTGSSPVSIRGSVVDNTAAAAIPDSTEMSGDGIVVTQGEAGTADPTLFVVDLADNTVTGAARAGILVDGVAAALNGNVAGADNGLVVSGGSIFSQHGAVTSGLDTVNALLGNGTLEISYDAFSVDMP